MGEDLRRRDRVSQLVMSEPANYLRKSDDRSPKRRRKAFERLPV
jgi:hypothetical protein